MGWSFGCYREYIVCSGQPVYPPGYGGSFSLPLPGGDRIVGQIYIEGKNFVYPMGGYHFVLDGDNIDICLTKLSGSFIMT
jgi:hypothetical protein